MKGVAGVAKGQAQERISKAGGLGAKQWQEFSELSRGTGLRLPEASAETAIASTETAITSTSRKRGQGQTTCSSHLSPKPITAAN